VESIQITRESGVVTITLNRPEKRNALDRSTFEALIEAFDEVDRRRDDRVLMITGAGSAFCSGADLTATRPRPEEPARSPGAAPSEPTASQPFGRGVGASLRLMRLVSRCALRLHSLSKPTIAAVNGPAMGAGCNLALSCDLVLASTDARFGEIFVNQALGLDFAGSWLLPRLVGLQRAKEVAFLGEVLDAGDAHRMGMVNRICEPATLVAEARQTAERIASRPPLALSVIKAQLNNSIAPALSSALPLEEVAQALAMNSSDARAALAARGAGTAPEFIGE